MRLLLDENLSEAILPVLVTRDEDFVRLSIVLGAPPKVIWLTETPDDAQALLVVDGVRVTSPARSIADAAAAATAPEHVIVATRQALDRGMVTRAQLAEAARGRGPAVERLMQRAVADEGTRPMRTIAIPLDRAQIAEFCRRNHIRRLALFGSVLGPGFGPESDVDVLVECESGYTPGFAFFALQEELTELLGRPVDLQTPQFLSAQFRDQVRAAAEVLYAA